MLIEFVVVSTAGLYFMYNEACLALSRSLPAVPIRTAKKLGHTAPNRQFPINMVQYIIELR